MSTSLAPPPWVAAAQAAAILNRSRVSTTNDSVSRCFGEELGQRNVLGAVAAALEPRRHRRLHGERPVRRGGLQPQPFMNAWCDVVSGFAGLAIPMPCRCTAAPAVGS